MKKSIFILSAFLALNASAQTPNASNEPGKPQPLTELNKDKSADAYPWISADGLRLYYTAEHEVAFTQRATPSEKFSAPVVVPINVKDIVSCELSSDELRAYVSNGTSLYYVERASISSRFSAPVKVSLTGIEDATFLAGASLDAKENILVLTVARNISDYSLEEFVKVSATSFEHKHTFEVDANMIFQSGQLSNDGLTYIASNNKKGDDKRICSLTRKSLEEAFSYTSMKELPGINSDEFANIQPAFSPDMKWIVFVRSSANSWQNNDLYIMYNTTSPVVMPKEEVTALVTPDAKTETVLSGEKMATDAPAMEFSSLVYPNPSTEFVKIKIENPSEAPVTISIFSINGELMSERVVNSGDGNEVTISTSELATGIYFVRCMQLQNGKPVCTNDKLVVQH